MAGRYCGVDFESRGFSVLEEWRDIKGFEGKYQVSNLGNVRSLDRVTNNRVFKGVTKKPQISNTGYYRVFLCLQNRKIKPFSIHRLVAGAFLERKEGLNIVNHLDGNRLNNVLNNLEWTTISGNTLHSYKNKLQVMGIGEDNPASKYTEEQIIEVKRLSKLGLKRKEISCITKVSTATIHLVLNNKRWTHV